MTAAKPTSLAKHDLTLLLGALGGLVALSWWYLTGLSRGMDGMGSTTGIAQWSSIDFLLMFVMWAVMMIGMMVPTALRSVLIFARIGARATARGRILVSAYWFAAGYVLIWTFFSAVATVSQWGLDQAALLSPMLVSTSPFLGAILLIKCRRLATIPRQGQLSSTLPFSRHVHCHAFPAGNPRRCTAGHSPRHVLPGLLLAAHGPAVRGWGHESAVDCGHYRVRAG